VIVLKQVVNKVTIRLQMVKWVLSDELGEDLEGYSRNYNRVSGNDLQKRRKIWKSLMRTHGHLADMSTLQTENLSLIALKNAQREFFLYLISSTTA
jgi:hypothetical protein